MRISELLYRQKDNTSIALKKGNDCITYQELHLIANGIANKIINLLNFDAKCVAIFLPNSINYAKAYFAIQYSNRICVPIGTWSSEVEILSTIDYCEVDLIITDSQNFLFLKKCLKVHKSKVYVYNIDNYEIFKCNATCDFIEKSDILENDYSDNDVAIMLHTSGTLRMPKRVMLTHKNLISNIESNICSLKLNRNDISLIVLPMCFGYCNTSQFLTHIYLGATMIILNGCFFPKLFFQTIETEKITNCTCVPSMLLTLLEYNSKHKYDFESLKYICFGGSKISIEKLKILILKFPSINFIHTYGQTEASPRVTALLPKDSLRKIGSVGKPIPNVQIKVVDSNGHELPNNKIGEILICGDNIMKGYYKRDDITKNTIVNGWLLSGDLGYIDEDKYLYVVGRKKNVIISGGINIYPEEVEDVLKSHPNVEEALVEGKDNLLLGEIPIAKIVLSKDCSVKTIMEFCRKKLSSFKIPTEIIVVDKINKTNTGKVLRRSK